METALMNVPALQRLGRYSFEVLPRSRVIAVEERHVLVGATYASADPQQSRRITADVVVFVSQNRANRGLYEELTRRGLETHIVGDSNAPRTLAEAIREGHLTGYRL